MQITWFFCLFLSCPIIRDVHYSLSNFMISQVWKTDTLWRTPPYAMISCTLIKHLDKYSFLYTSSATSIVWIWSDIYVGAPSTELWSVVRIRIHRFSAFWIRFFFFLPVTTDIWSNLRIHFLYIKVWTFGIQNKNLFRPMDYGRWVRHISKNEYLVYQSPKSQSYVSLTLLLTCTFVLYKMYC